MAADAILTREIKMKGISRPAKNDVISNPVKKVCPLFSIRLMLLSEKV